MKLKRLLPTATLLVVLPTIILATSCSKEIDVDIDTPQTIGEDTQCYVTTAIPYPTINTRTQYEISIDFEDFLQQSKIKDWHSPITTWWVGISTDNTTFEPAVGQFNKHKVWINDILITDFIVDSTNLMITCTTPIQPSMNLEIEIDVQVDQTISNGWFVFYCET